MPVRDDTVEEVRKWIQDDLAGGRVEEAKESLPRLFLAAHDDNDYQTANRVLSLIATDRTPTADMLMGGGAQGGSPSNHDKHTVERWNDVVLEYDKIDKYRDVLSQEGKPPSLHSLIKGLPNPEDPFDESNADYLQEDVYHNVREVVDDLRFQYIRAERDDELTETVSTMYDDPDLDSFRDSESDYEDQYDDDDDDDDDGGEAFDMPDLDPGPVKDAKTVKPAMPKGFDESAEVKGSLPDGVSLNQSGYGKRYKRG